MQRVLIETLSGTYNGGAMASARYQPWAVRCAVGQSATQHPPVGQDIKTLCRVVRCRDL